MADPVPPTPNNPSQTGPTGSPGKVGVYDRPSTATPEPDITPGTSGMANTAPEPGPSNQAYYGTQASPMRWVVPAIIVVLLILALLWWT